MPGLTRRSYAFGVAAIMLFAVVGSGCEQADSLGDLGAETPDAFTPSVQFDTSGVEVPVCQVDDDCKATVWELGECEAAICTPSGQCEVRTLDNGTPCVDGHPCTGPDFCVEGQCGGGVIDCDDDDPCTEDSCDDKEGCRSEPVSDLPCDDEDPCTGADTCVEGLCTGEPVEACCQYDAECDDDDPCTDDACTEDNVCSYTFNLAPCDDGSLCTSQDHCEEGACGGTPTLCDDGDPCTDDICDAETGACGTIAAVDGTECEDGNVCTGPDVCQAGLCEGLENLCQCINDAECFAFEDTDLCNGTLICQNFECVVDPLTVVACNPIGDTECLKNQCDSGTGQCVPTATADGTPCDDQNICTLTDACQAGACSGDTVPCDDGNPCTEDACSPEFGCQNTANTLPCDDQDACTDNDLCGDGACSGEPITCDDDNGCTDDTCAPETGCLYDPNSAPCDDGNPCTDGDTCEGSSCQSGANTCQCVNDGDCIALEDGDLCNGTLRCVDNVCEVNPSTVVACNTTGDTTCIKNQCDPNTGACTPMNEVDGLACDDANLCTTEDSCQSGLCLGDAVICDDANDCTLDVCTPNEGCQHPPAVQLCDDDNACTQNDQCQEGTCVGQTLNCDDLNACTDDACAPETGCTHESNAADCDDGNPCTAGDACQDGSCKPGDNACQCVTDADCVAEEDGDLCNGTLRCVDNACEVNPTTVVVCNTTGDTTCVKNVCSPSTGVCAAVSQEDGLACDDANLCTGDDSCQSGICVGAGVDCDDDNPCTLDACDPVEGCLHPDAVQPCNDQDPCTQNDQCYLGYCMGQPVSCDDQNGCTDDACGAEGCTHVANTASCSDGNPCTTGDTCTDEACVPGGNTCECVSDADCAAEEDGDLCNGTLRCVLNKCLVDPGTLVFCNTTGDTTCEKTLCEPTTGACGKTPVEDGLPCHDESVCTLDDTCQAGLCYGESVPCDDGNPCTDDTCDPVEGCVFTPNTSSCDDGDACTDDDLCQDGTCKGALVTCDDTDVCTVDSCDPTTGCVYGDAPLGHVCNDDNACTVQDHCNAGVCTGSPADCSDDNPCTADSCSEADGCAHTDLNNGTPCQDADACTIDEVCTDGACGGSPLSCADNDPCTADSCDPATGCVYPLADDGTDCSDEDACTDGDQCQGGVCQPGNLVCQCTVDTDCAAYEDGDLCNGTLFCSGDNVCEIDPGSVVTCNIAGDTDCRKNTCVPDTGTCHQLDSADGTGCDDQNLCTDSDACTAGFCGGTAVTCDDENLCTNDGCDPATGCIHQPNTLFCNDGDACTTADQCVDEVCAGDAVTCDDQNPCTTDHCDPVEGCQYTPVTDGELCNDKNACTVDDVCTAGVCGGAVAVCDDQNPCTSDSCAPATGCAHVALPNASDCSDKDACTVDDQCVSGACVGVPAVCTDIDPCTAESCEPDVGCVYPNAPDGVLCNDGNDCTEGDSCGAGTCVPGGSVCECESTADCADLEDGDLCNGTLICGAANTCIVDPATLVVCDISGDTACSKTACEPATGTCAVQQVAAGTLCTDGDACTKLDACSDGVCQGTPIVCDDTNVCTTDGCNAETGCTHEPTIGDCTDGNACTSADTCMDGACVGAPVLCDDTNPCTVDSCDPDTGCQAPPAANGTACGDGDACNGAELCQAGICTAGLAPVCDDGNPCTADTCDPLVGCQAPPAENGTSCVDEDVCNGAETCQAGSCTPGAPLVCVAAGLCSKATCDAVAGCDVAALADGTDCGDGNVCNGAETCDDGLCVSGEALACDDVNPCTADSCLPVTGCDNADVVDGTACVDGDVCNGAETCQAGTCTIGTPLTCDDANPCTVDGCDAGEGCTASTAPVGTTCADGDVCNGAELCVGDVCTVGTELECDDTNPCTVDLCDADAGCESKPALNGLSCGDGNVCNGAETCQAGTCQASVALDCDDSNLCTTDSCDLIAGCQHATLADGETCGDGNLCNGAELCQAGVCASGAALNCDDANPCTDDDCTSDLGCVNPVLADGTSCDDDTICNGLELCALGECVAGTALDCGDGTVCTDRTCHPSQGCTTTNLANGTPCPDGDVCTGDETCLGGACKLGIPLVCDDTNPCTEDICDAIGGCGATPVTDGTACGDGDACDGVEMCQGGVCADAVGGSCDDDNPCTVDSCVDDGCVHVVDPGAASACPVPDNQCEVAICDVELGGCSTAFIPPGTDCDDGDDFCTMDDFCYEGMCLAYSVVDEMSEPVCDPRNCLDASAALTCGEYASFELNDPTGTDIMSTYGCEGAEGYTGHEMAFLVTPPPLMYEMPLTLAVELADPSLKGTAYADIIVLEATDDYQCWADNCVAVGTMDDTGVATVEIPAFVDSDGDASNDVSYIVLVDGRDGFNGSVRLASWCAPGYKGIELYCTDGVDDDTDGTVDCEDSSCWDSDLCLFEHDCDNGSDDDEDGDVDCDDVDCDTHPDCFVETVCDDGIDDEGDGLTDCDDDDCEFTPACGDVCEGAIPLSCGDILYGEDPATGSNTFTSFPHSPAGQNSESVDYDSTHHIYHLQAPAECSARFKVTPVGPSGLGTLDIYALAPGCTEEHTVWLPGSDDCVNPQTPSTALWGAEACVRVTDTQASSTWITAIPDNEMASWGFVDFSYDLEVICDCP